MKKNLMTFLYSFSTLLYCLIIFSSYATTRQPTNNKKFFDTSIASKLPQIPAHMSFAGEAVPLERWEIKEQLEREFTLIYYETGTMLYIINLANRWFPFIEERLRANGIPTDFKYLCVAESNLQNLVSKSLAVGFWQFMSNTAPSYNLEISANVDERYNVLKSTEAACQYLKQAYAKFGSWTAAAASFNCGQGAYSSQAAFQQTKNYYDLYIREETNKYIFRILTFKHLMENKEKYGYAISFTEAYKPLKTVSVPLSASIYNLAQFAIKHGTTYKMLRILNPWIRNTSLTVKPGKTYLILLPGN